MSRRRPPDRFQDLIRHGADAFIAGRGYGRTQMEDVAGRVGVSKGTLYLYVESKAALFDLVVRHADNYRDYEPPEDLPIRAGRMEDLVLTIRERIDAHPGIRQAHAILENPDPDATPEEFARVMRALYRAISENRRAIKLVDMSVRDYPGLGDQWFRLGRGMIMGKLTPYIERGIARGRFLPLPNPMLAARFILENYAYWGMHRHFDAQPISVPEDDVEETLVAICQRFLFSTASPTKTKGAASSQVGIKS